MQANFDKIKKYVHWILDCVLGILGLLIVIFMVRHLVDISTYIFKPMSPTNFSQVMQEVISFFMLFEFIMMILRYIQEGHHIPIRYLILICITAILRQLMVIHGEGMQTLLLAFSILLLVCVLYILGLSGNQFHSSGKSTMEEDFIGEKKR
ncbi:phosphate-starvation-inducible protein PsiE [Enterococcus faecalis]